MKMNTRLATSLRFLESVRVNDCVDINSPAPSGLSLAMSASSTVTVEYLRFGLSYCHIGCVKQNIVILVVLSQIFKLEVFQLCTSCSSGSAFPDLTTCASHQVHERFKDVYVLVL